MTTLAGLVAKNPQRVIMFDENGDQTTVEKDKVFTLDITYQSMKDVTDAVYETAERGVTNAKKAIKDLIKNQDKANDAVCLRALNGWELTMRGARAMRAQFDFSQMENLDEVIDYSEQNVKLLLEVSSLSAILQETFTDYESWFPFVEELAKNSDSGPSSSTEDTPAPPASEIP